MLWIKMFMFMFMFMFIVIKPPNYVTDHIVYKGKDTCAGAAFTWIFLKNTLSQQLSLRMTPALTSAAFLLAAKFSNPAL